MLTEFVSAEQVDVPEGFTENGLELFGMHFEGFRRLTGPGVYMASIGTGETFELLYIGSAKNILARISEASHGSLRRAFEVKDCRLLIIACKSEKHARKVESDLILAYRPKFNIAGVPTTECQENE